jgi:hypothetical protein
VTPPPTDPPDAPRSIPYESKYDPRYAAIAKAACERMAATNSDLAALFGVVEKTIRNWAVQHPEFHTALLMGKEVANQRVERALYTRAVGYEYESEKIFFDNANKRVIRVPVTVHVPPDTWACNTWLMNRDPDRWRHKFELAHVKPAEVTDQPLSTEEWDRQYGTHGPGRGN